MKEQAKRPLPFHTKGIRWRFSDGTEMIIGPDGAARRLDPKVRQSRKARIKARRQKEKECARNSS